MKAGVSLKHQPLQRRTSFGLGSLITNPLSFKRRQSSDSSSSEKTTTSSSGVYLNDRDSTYSSTVESICEENNTKPTNVLKGILKTSYSPIKKHVTFSSKRSIAQVHIIEPFVQYAGDLWWTKEETTASKAEQSDFTNASESVKEIVREYVQGVKNGRKQIRQLQQLQEQQELGATNHSTVKITVANEHYQRLVKGRSYGLAGLETYLGYRKEVQLITMKIADQYYNEDDPNKYYSFVRSLTAADRTWAIVVGRADMEAANSINSEDDICI